MTFRVSRRALDQIRDVLGGIAMNNAQAGEKLGARIEQALGRVRQFPSSGRIVPEFGDPSRREIIVRPFRLVYRITQDEIRVVAFFHAHRLLDGALSEDEG